MSNEQKVWSKVTRVLKKRMKGLHERYIVVWAMMVAGIVLSRKARLSRIAEELPTKALDTSTMRRLQRFVSNPRVDVQTHYMPFAAQILEALSVNRLVLAIDGSQVGKNCMIMMVGVVYQNRLLPLTWQVYTGKKGHATTERHIAVLQQLLPMIPEGSDVVLLGDGEFDKIPLLEWLEEEPRWGFVVRTAKSRVYWSEGREDRLKYMAEKGYVVWDEEVLFTGQKFGPVMAIAWWDENHPEPIYLLSSLSDVDEVCALYRKRALIETLFSDQKSRGFGIDKSHLEDPEKLNRLMMGACLAYLWMIWLGVEAIRKEQTHRIGPKSRCDKSLFRLGIDWLKHLLKKGWKIDVSFDIPEITKVQGGVM
jgi:hypothetical protein